MRTLQRKILITLFCLAGAAFGSGTLSNPGEFRAKTAPAEVETPAPSGSISASHGTEVSERGFRPEDSEDPPATAFGKEFYRRLFHGALTLAIIGFAGCVRLGLILRKIRRSSPLVKLRPETNPTNPPLPVFKTPPPEGEKTDRITDGIRRIVFEQEGFRDPTLSMTGLADRLNVNRSDLSRIINEKTGKHFNYWLNEIRVREALCCLLEKSPQTSVAEIAYDTGFNDRTIFFRAFKKLTGISPTGFCRSMGCASDKKTGE